MHAASRAVVNTAVVIVLASALGVHSTATAEPGDAQLEPSIQYELVEGIPYRDPAGPDDHGTREGKPRCAIDLYYPVLKDSEEASADTEPFTTVIWLHAGGLRFGERYIPGELREQGFAVAAVGYRLVPHVDARTCIDDAAAGVAWVLNNIERFGGDPDRVILAGTSAGGYLALLIGMDPSRLEGHGLAGDAGAARLLGLASLSGHTVVHEAVRAEAGIPRERATADAEAPIFHVRAELPPIFLTTGDRDMELLGRYEEVAFFERMLKVAGHTEHVLYELEGYGHDAALERAALPLLVEWVGEIGAGAGG